MVIKVINYKEVQSTMDVALKHLGEDIILITAEQQIEGRGRGKNSWFSPPGGFYATYIIPLEKKLNHISIAMFHYLASLLVVTSLSSISKKDFKIKWPNDIIYDNKKVAGILIEYLTKTEELNHLLIGIGINNNNRTNSFPEVISDSATSLSEVLKKEIDPKLIIEELNSRIKNNLELLKKENRGLIEQYNKHTVYFKRKIKVNDGEIYFCKGINSKGQLVLESDKRTILLPIGDRSTLELVK